MNSNKFGFHKDDKNLRELEKYISFVDKNRHIFKPRFKYPRFGPK